ncbi:titin-like [Vespa velutina]|uniref:titin-like n=1 Tax=Vespa velutina TaxID=202808 RepID=UPI001FB4E985|nr:titin-like [Vespa velutina]
MADEEMEDDFDRERKSLITYKEESFIERQSKVESLPEIEDVKIEDEKYLTIDENEERINTENDKEEIESPLSKDLGDVSLKKNDATNRKFRNIIGKRESRKEELEKLEGDLRQRLDVLECSMPAVMVWNVWQHMSQGSPIPNLHRLMEKQFRTPAAGEVCCPSTPSRHYDCRVREIEAERKAAQRRLDEARVMWLEKEVKLKERREKLEDAKRIQKERKEKIERLTNEAKELREALKKMNEEAEEGMASFCESGECGDIQCRERWLRGVNSVDSIKASDVECLARLRELAENELTMKKQIAELERREETYMRTLQHADEMWSKMEGDTADTMSALQMQLDTKTKTNQQLASRICELEDELEKLRAKMALCKSELTKYVSVERIETIIGSEDDFAKTTDKMVGIRPKIADKAIEKEYDVFDKEILMKVDVEDKEVSIDVEKPIEFMESEDEETIIDAKKPIEFMEAEDEEAIIDAEKPTELMKPEDEEFMEAEDEEAIIDREKPIKLKDLKETEVDIDIDDIDIEKPTKPIEPEKMDAIHKYLSMLGSLDELYYDDDYGICSPEYECYEDWQEPEIDEEQPSIVHPDFPPIITEKVVPTDDIKEKLKDLKQIDDKEEKDETYEDIDEKMKEPEQVEEKVDVPELKAAIDKDSANVPLIKLRSWFYTVDSIRSVISKCPTCSVVKLDVDTLIEDIGKYAEVDATEITLKLTIEVEADKKEPIVDELKKEVVPEIMEEVISPEDIIRKIEIEPEREILSDLVKKPIEEIKEEISMMVEEKPKIEEAEVVKPIITEVLPKVIKEKDKVELIVEPPTLVPDKVDVIFEKPKEEITEDADIPIKEPEIEYDKFIVPTKVEKMEKDIVVVDEGMKEKKDLEDETKIILPIQELIDEKKKEDKKDIELTDDIDKDIIKEIVELEEKIEEIKVEHVVPIREKHDIEDVEKLLTEEETMEEKKKAEVVAVKVEELEAKVLPKPEIEEEEIIEPLLKIKLEKEVPFAEEIFVDAKTLEDLPLIKDIPETLKYDEIPIEEDVERIVVTDKIPVEDKPEDMEEIKEIEAEVEPKEEVAEVEPKEEVAEVEPEEMVKVEPEEMVKVEPEEEVTEVEPEEMVEVEPEEKVTEVEPEEMVEVEPEEMVKVEPEEEMVKVEPEEEMVKVEPEEEVAEVEPEEEVAEVEPEEEVAEVEPAEVIKEIKMEPIEEIEEIEEVEPIEEVEEIEEIAVELIKELIEPSLISVKEEEEEEEEEEEIKEKLKIPIDPRIVPMPYLAVADIEEIKKEPSIDAVIKKEMIPCVCKKPEEITRPPVLPPMQIIINKTEIVQTVIHKGTQTRVVQSTKIKTTDQKSTRMNDSEISSKKMHWQKRPKNKSALPCSHVSSQTSTTHDSISSEKQRLFINILKSLKLDLSTEEKKIRSINYSQFNVTDKCNCCVCGKDNISFRAFDKHCNRTFLKDLKTDVPKIDQNGQDESTLKSNITGKLRTCIPYISPKISKAIEEICDREMCTCSTLIEKGKRNINKSEKKDQSCLAKMSNKLPKICNNCNRKKDEGRFKGTMYQDKLIKCNMAKIKDTKDQKDLDNSSNCICTNVEKSQSGRLLKQEICGCEEL